MKQEPGVEPQTDLKRNKEDDLVLTTPDPENASDENYNPP